MTGIETQVELLKYRRTRIVATLGPSSSTSEVIGTLIDAGVNVFRLNMSHGDHDGHRERYEVIRAEADRRGVIISILADLCGPKIRVGEFPGGSVDLVGGTRVTVTTRDLEGTAELIPSQYTSLADDVNTGDRILLDDGNLELKVESVSGTEIVCTVVHGGVLKNRKGMNLPGVRVSAPSLTEKDRTDAVFARDLGVDLIALSFVRSADDVRELRTLLGDEGAGIGIVAKIEKPEALREIEEIAALSDGIMVARGDLGVELPPEEVPLAQEQLIDLGRRLNRPVIVATQMLESMIDHARPTRAEVSDVANAVRSGADAVMLSAETAAGEFPVESVRMMDTVCRQVEGYLWEQGEFEGYRTVRGDGPPSVDVALSNATTQLSRDLHVRAIMVVTRHGHTAAALSASRPAAPLVALTTECATAHVANLLWGVIPVCVQSYDAPEEVARQAIAELQLGVAGESALMVRGFHPDPALNQPSVTILTI